MALKNDVSCSALRFLNFTIHTVLKETRSTFLWIGANSSRKARLLAASRAACLLSCLTPTLASSDVFSKNTSFLLNNSYTKSAFDSSPDAQTHGSEEGPVLASRLGGGRAGGTVLELIEQAANRYANHPAVSRAGFNKVTWSYFVRSMIEVESAYKIKARSHAGAIGLAQLMPGTAKLLRVDPHDPVQNLDGGVRYLVMQLDRFGTAELALAAYNAGPGAVIKYGNKIPNYRETKNHVALVMRRYRTFLL